MDVSKVLIIVFIIVCIVLPLSLFVIEKCVVLIRIEEIGEIVDMAIDSIVLELDLDELGYGDLALTRRLYQQRVEGYLQAHLVEYEAVEMTTYLNAKGIGITAKIECLFEPHAYKALLPKEVEYEVVKTYQLLVDR
jgi:hypothetical protein